MKQPDSQTVREHLEKCAAQIADWETSRSYCLEVANDYQKDIDDLKRWINSITSVDVTVDHARYHAAKFKRRENRKRKIA